ncbi:MULTISPECIES: hypothetical protein [unclassified Pseudonocardia]|uniref:hypothetical protein n=1 Tax=unclassified Pseudonocardia TaxID=2619320 RepID=UPI000A92A8F2|nr:MULTISPECIES: hypothetical protein [unclassified Pseudonocardia]
MRTPVVTSTVGLRATRGPTRRPFGAAARITRPRARRCLIHRVPLSEVLTSERSAHVGKIHKIQVRNPVGTR